MTKPNNRLSNGDDEQLKHFQTQLDRLRELWLAEDQHVAATIEANITAFSSEGLRYATEKMPREEQLRLRALRKTQIAAVS